MNKDYEQIYLQPACCADPETGRLWCQDVPEDCEDGAQWTRYVRAGIGGYWTLCDHKLPPKAGFYDVIARDSSENKHRITNVMFTNNKTWMFEGATPLPLEYEVVYWMSIPITPEDRKVENE